MLSPGYLTRPWFLHIDHLWLATAWVPPTFLFLVSIRDVPIATSTSIGLTFTCSCSDFLVTTVNRSLHIWRSSLLEFSKAEMWRRTYVVTVLLKISMRSTSVLVIIMVDKRFWSSVNISSRLGACLVLFTTIYCRVFISYSWYRCSICFYISVFNKVEVWLMEILKVYRQCIKGWDSYIHPNSMLSLIFSFRSHSAQNTSSLITDTKI